jgi:hypothetical protein
MLLPQVLTAGIKAMEERAPAKAAFRAAVEAAAKEERERWRRRQGQYGVYCICAG